MIISRTPFRISFFGGGTDYPAWYRENGGAVLSTTINKYCYLTCRYLPPFHQFKHLIRYYKREEAQSVDDIQHPSVRECLKFLDVEEGIDLVHHADLPARSGLGSSSTFTVGLLHALYALKHEMPTKRKLAINAINIEQDRIGEHVGSQDQAAAAFGGLNRIEFGGPHEINVRPLIMRPERFESLQQYMMLFFTGYSRIASEVAADQIAQIPSNRENLLQMMQLVDEAESLLLSKEDRLNEFGKLLHDQWMLKREMSSRVSTPEIDRIYETGIKAGALGGKLLGAGSGGFMMMFVEPDKQEAVKKALGTLLHVPFHFDTLGSQIIYYSQHDQY